MQMVVVNFRFGAVPCMKIGLSRLNSYDADVGGKKRVDGEEKAFIPNVGYRSENNVSVEVSDLPFGVNACVCTARTGEVRGMSKYGDKSLLNKRLDRWAVVLYLPAAVVCPVIGNF